jgi:hypothetical protein
MLGLPHQHQRPADAPDDNSISIVKLRAMTGVIKNKHGVC